MAEAKDGLVSSFFSLEITGKLVGAFREFTNLGSENQVVEDKARGPDGKYIIKKIPGTLKWNDITPQAGHDRQHGHVEVAPVGRGRQESPKPAPTAPS